MESHNGNLDELSKETMAYLMMPGRVRYPLVHGGIDSSYQVISTVPSNGWLLHDDIVFRVLVYKALSFGFGRRYWYRTAKLELFRADPYKTLGISVSFMRMLVDLLKRIPLMGYN